jgi:hypothetical protein
MQLKVVVTQDCIDRGKRKMITCCPVALAFEQAGYPASIDGIFVYSSGVDDMILRLPTDVEQRISDYDHGNGMKPFEFDIEVPDAA